MKRAKKSGLRPTDGEIDLEARQWAEEYATRCENTQITRQEIFAAGARWARGVAQPEVHRTGGQRCTLTVTTPRNCPPVRCHALLEV
jgi:hypothetical protein